MWQNIQSAQSAHSAPSALCWWHAYNTTSDSLSPLHLHRFTYFTSRLKKSTVPLLPYITRWFVGVGGRGGGSEAVMLYPQSCLLRSTWGWGRARGVTRSTQQTQTTHSPVASLVNSTNPSTIPFLLSVSRCSLGGARRLCYTTSLADSAVPEGGGGQGISLAPPSTQLTNSSISY